MEWIPKTLSVADATPAVIAKALRHHLSPEAVAEVVQLLDGGDPPAAAKPKGQPPPKPKPKAARMTDAEKCEALYAAYPRKVGKAAAVRAIEKALEKATFEDLSAAVTEYAKSREGKDPQFTPHPATWFNREQWNDDRSEWFRAESGGRTKARYKPGPGERFDPTAELGSL